MTTSNTTQTGAFVPENAPPEVLEALKKFGTESLKLGEQALKELEVHNKLASFQEQTADSKDVQDVSTYELTDEELQTARSDFSSSGEYTFMESSNEGETIPEVKNSNSTKIQDNPEFLEIRSKYLEQAKKIEKMGFPKSRAARFIESIFSKIGSLIKGIGNSLFGRIQVRT